MKDEPIVGTVTVARMLWPSSLICIVSGRSDVAEDLTRGWLDQHAVPFDRLIMRPDDTENGVFKVNAVQQLQAEGLSVELFFEDWAPAAKYIYEQTKVPVLGVNPFDPETCLVGREQLAMELDQELADRYGRGHDHETGTCHVSGKDLAEIVFTRLAGEHA